MENDCKIKLEAYTPKMQSLMFDRVKLQNQIVDCKRKIAQFRAPAELPNSKDSSNTSKMPITNKGDANSKMPEPSKENSRGSSSSSSSSGHRTTMAAAAAAAVVIAPPAVAAAAVVIAPPVAAAAAVVSVPVAAAVTAVTRVGHRWPTVTRMPRLVSQRPPSLPRLVSQRPPSLPRLVSQQPPSPPKLVSPEIDPRRLVKE
jgi:hypothetical protein